MPYAVLPENAIAALPKLSGAAVKTMNAIASFMPGRGAECYPSLAAIGERAGIKREKTLSAAIRELTAAGVIVCERRRRQTNLLKWSKLEPAESAETRILEPAVSAAPKPLEPAESAPLDSVLEPAVSAPVYPAVSAPRKETRKETNTAYAHDDEKSHSPEGDKPSETSSEIPGAVPPSPPGESTPPAAKKPSEKPKADKPSPKGLDVDAGKLVDLYAQLVKPKREDNSGSRKTFLATATRLLSEGKLFEELERSIRNYASTRIAQERNDKNPDAAKQYRFGFQTFFGPKFEHWKDFTDVVLEVVPPKAGDLTHLDYWQEIVSEQYGAEWGHRFRERAVALGDEKAALAWVKEHAAVKKELCHA